MKFQLIFYIYFYIYLTNQISALYGNVIKNTNSATAKYGLLISLTKQGNLLNTDSMTSVDVGSSGAGVNSKNNGLASVSSYGIGNGKNYDRSTKNHIALGTAAAKANNSTSSFTNIAYNSNSSGNLARQREKRRTKSHSSDSKSSEEKSDESKETSKSDESTEHEAKVITSFRVPNREKRSNQMKSDNKNHANKLNIGSTNKKTKDGLNTSLSVGSSGVNVGDVSTSVSLGIGVARNKKTKAESLVNAGSSAASAGGKERSTISVASSDQKS